MDQLCFFLHLFTYLCPYLHSHGFSGTLSVSLKWEYQFFKSYNIERMGKLRKSETCPWTHDSKSMNMFTCSDRSDNSATFISDFSHLPSMSCEQDCACMCYTLTFLALGVVRVFSMLFFLFLTLLGLTLLTVRVMLVGVCWVAVYDTAEADMSSSPLSVALLSPTVKADIN